MGGPFTQEFIELVRSAADIVRVISDYVPLKGAGARLKGLCPFHQEKTPSFSVDPDSQLFYCFGCQTGGDVFKFLMIYEKLDFVEAVEQLANRFGVPLPSEPRRSDDPTERLRQLTQTAQAYFRSTLEGRESGRRCREYLEQRGLGDKLSQQLQLGFAPDSWDATGVYLRSKGFRDDEIRSGGLALPRKSGQGQYDRFRDRLIFPIRDINGRTIAFGGRVIGDGEPKYINSPETPIYTKGSHLYGLDLAKQAIRREGFAIIVEGYLDLAALLQAGIDNVVASLGTAFTPLQAKLLSRVTRRVSVSYDGDAAGATATIRSLDMLLNDGFEVRVVDLPAGMDPDDCIRKQGAEAYGQLVRAAPEYLQFLVDRQARSRNLDLTEEKLAAVNELLPHLAKLGSSIERASWASRLADTLRIEDVLVLQELRAALRSAKTTIRQRPDTSRPLHECEARLVALLLGSESERQRWAAELDLDELEGTRVLMIVKTIVDQTRQGKTVDYPHVLELLDDEASQGLLTRIAFSDQPEKGPAIEDCLWTIRKANLQRQERQVLREIGKLQKVPESASDGTDVDRQLKQLQHLAQQRDAL